MSNIPAGDTSARVVPGVQTFCEWLVRLAGQIATCVESAEMVVDHIASHGRIPVSAAEDISLTQDLINRGQADPDGATNSDAASAQMVRLGIPNVHMHQAASSWDWVGQIKSGVDRGMASIYGFNQAHLTHDDWTNTATNAGVYGHGVAIVGYDATGAIVADPNTQQAADGNFVHYSWDNLNAAASGNPDVVTPEGSMSTPYDSYFDIVPGKYTLKSNPALTISGGALDLWLATNGAAGLPRSGPNYRLQGELGASQLAYVVFERAIMVWDPAHKLDSPPQQDSSGQFYFAHVDDPRFALYPAPAAPPASVVQPKLLVDGQAVSFPYTVPAHTVTIAE